VPQGSVLRLLLCLLYTADLPVALGFTTSSYAGDTAVFVAYNHIEAITEKPLSHSEIIKEMENQS